MDIMLASLTESSYKQYNSCLKKWWKFCENMKISPFESSIENILLFLTNIFESGAAHSSINCYRSAVSLLVGPEIAQDDRMKRFFKGLSKLRPSKPKYDSTWDPKIVLDYLSSLSKNEELSLKILTMKLITLFALITGHRMQTFALIKIENVLVTNKHIEIKIPDRIKTSGANRKQSCLVLPFYKKNRKICAASTLQHYLEKTKDLRSNINSLFISHKKPHKKVTSQTLSRWIKEILENSGIDTNVFTAHSTRHASTSAAKRRGIDIDTVRRTAGWTKKSNTFIKFYNLNLTVPSDAFGKAIVSS
ncbi:hypothetical protein TSAR_005755 [Trichomalopsis sarcophagae]|uniref:Tyr recombinase domain-containing protein n=1 Tax=Trichomalopsis sarcophagae TaxID=543379 RepID=A0A232EKD0_9HYME|nr:hypothetical protein TSAR_005755 [Trichomalopsis sarcophagae]